MTRPLFMIETREIEGIRFEADDLSLLITGCIEGVRKRAIEEAKAQAIKPGLFTVLSACPTSVIHNDKLMVAVVVTYTFG